MKIAFNRKRILFAIPIVILIAIVGIGVYLLIAKGNLKIPSQKLFTKKVKVELKTAYKNPFDKDSQYVNPFQEQKNPFVVNR